MPTKVKCPQCGKPVEWKPENKHRPFCSDRCRLIDLGAWAAEEHKIAGNSQFDDVMSENLNDH
ncbi:DNA gyrase inhibitor YacG [Parendozoicomonas haliclonae]|uniref:DNA gyrase inhibitor YacG n=1 Tax=Parendozoicomonas haliclonae TaxID=1960125 RepID=A0A1X7AEF9_9GAMM|nr:DNA gyrase inhibitor YacG [Parendozoicomonas haliclonae]SMA34401.1 DNA gyrase inhibitor YacG [Parendozoicomonas haliclonae]